MAAKADGKDKVKVAIASLAKVSGGADNGKNWIDDLDAEHHMDWPKLLAHAERGLLTRDGPTDYEKCTNLIQATLFTVVFCFCLFCV